MADFERLAAKLDIQEEEKVRKLQIAVPRAWLDYILDAEGRGHNVVLSGTPTGTTGYEVKMMWEDIGIPKRVESQRNGEWVLVWDLMEEKNRSLLCDGHTWNFGPVKARCSVKARDFCLEEAKRAIVKEIEKQESRGAVSLRADSRPKAGSEKVILSESEPEYTRQVTFQGKGV